MRQRTTWIRDDVRTAASQVAAATQRRADPYLMNQDHVNRNPPADKYENGTPSSWAEDVHTPNRWQSEYAGGTTKRNEIGQADFRSETFTHPERTANDQGLVLKKSDLCVTIARMMLPKTASDSMVEDQAVEMMGLSDAAVIDTYNRLANQQDQQGQGQGQEQQQQATQQDQQGQGQQQQQQQATQQTQDQQQGQQQQQQATQQTQTAMQQCIEAFQQGDQNKFLAALQQMQSGQGAFPGGQNNPVATAKPKTAQDQGQQQGQGQGQHDQQQQANQSQLAMYQQQTQAMQSQIQAMQQQLEQLLQGQGQGQQQIQEQGLVQASDDDLLAEMMATSPTGGAVGEPTAELDVQLDPSAMDMSEITVTAEEQAQLNQLFASPELHAAEQQQQGQQGQGQQHQAALRSPSTRTVGTQPSQGVRKVGGVGGPVVKTAASEVSDLSKLWNTAPDVREVFGIPS